MKFATTNLINTRLVYQAKTLYTYIIHMYRLQLNSTLIFKFHTFDETHNFDKIVEVCKFQNFDQTPYFYQIHIVDQTSRFVQISRF